MSNKPAATERAPGNPKNGNPNESSIVFRRMVQDDADGVARVEAACMPGPWSRQSFWEEASHTDA